MQPKITLDNFGLIGQGATYWLENFDIKNDGGKNVLTSAWYNLKRYDIADTYGSGFTNLTTIRAFDNFIDLSGNLNVVGFTGDKIFMIAPVVTSASKGQIHDQGAEGTGVNAVSASDYPDIEVTKEGNILYTNAHHIGIGWYGKCASGSSTTKIIDSAGRNFTTLGVLNNGASSTNVSKYVYNLVNKERYLVTSITTTNATNDTLNFSAGTANDENDEFIVFVDNGWTGSDNFEFNVSAIRDQHFKGQAVPSTWRRQITLFGDDYVILNGNYLATLNINLTTFAATAKQLPYSTQAMCSAVNNANILVGCERKGKGSLLLWDSYTSGWNSILETDTPVYAIEPYRDGWLALIGNTLYYTNGYDKTKLSEIPDYNLYTLAPEYHFNQMTKLEDKVFIVGIQYIGTRARCGTYCYDMVEKGWTFIPHINKAGYNDIYIANYTALHPILSNGVYNIYNSSLDSLNYFKSGSGTTSDNIALFKINLPRKMRLSYVELNITYKSDRIENSLNDTANTIYVSYGDGRRPLFSNVQISSASTVSSLVNSSGATLPAKVGQEVLIADSTYAPAGERTWITGITNAGTSTETLAISPSLSADVTGDTQIIIHDLYKADSKTITYDTDVNFLQTLQYNLNDFYSDKLWLEVYLTGTTIYPIDLISINIY